MSNAASARQPGQQGQQQAGSQAQIEAQKAAEGLKQAGQRLQSMRKQQNGSEIGDLANKAEQLAGQQQDFEQRLRRNFGQGQSNQQTAQQMADEKQRMLEQYNDLQKQMQQASRDVAGTQPGVSKDLRDAMGKSQQEEIATRMEFTEEALRRGLGQYAVMREAPVTQSLNELKEQLKKLEAESASQGATAGGDDRSQMAMQQALNNTERIRREMEQLNRAQGQKGQNGNQQGNQPGNKPGNHQGNQPGGQQQGQNGQQGGQQPGQQAGNGQQGGQQPGQQAGNKVTVNKAAKMQAGGRSGQSQQGSVNPNGGGYGVNTAPRNGTAGGAGDQPFGAYNYGGGDTRMGALPQGTTPEQAYSDLMRDIGRLRGSVIDDKDLNREYQDLVRRAQELDPRHMNNDPQLGAVIGAQALSEIDELELVLRKKLAQGDGSVRSTSPRNIPPGYDAAVAEYTKRLSKQ